MTDQQPYTPSKHLVGYAYVRTNAIKAPDHELWDEYHRFIAQVEAAAEQRGAARALRELAKDAALVPAAPDKAAKFYRDRADQEGDDADA